MPIGIVAQTTDHAVFQFSGHRCAEFVLRLHELGREISSRMRRTSNGGQLAMWRRRKTVSGLQWISAVTS